MTQEVENAIPLNARLLARADSALREDFGHEFDLWVRGETWHHVAPDGVIQQTLSQEPATDLHELLNAVVEAGQPATLATSDGLLLGIPLRHSISAPLVATRNFGTMDEPTLNKFAALFHKHRAQRDDVESLQQENQAFLRQVTNDFEELTFLRSMADLLEISNLSFDFLAMAEAVVPTLKPLLEAEGLLLIEAVENEVADESHVGQPAIWSGARSVDTQVCRRLVEQYQKRCREQPVVRNHYDDTDEGAEFAGVASFILVPIISRDRTIGWLLAINRNNDRNINVGELPWEGSYLEFGTHEATLMSSSAAILATHCRNVELFREREDLLVSVVRALVSAIEAKDEYTRGHSERVALYGKRLAAELGYSAEYCERLYLTGLLHDVGKIGVSDAVLRKPGGLTDEEFEEIKTHPDKGWAILQDLAALSYVLPGVLHHHERIDGKGYPDGLASDEIPMDGRLLAVVDAYDAMTSDRSYRPGMPQEKAEAILQSGAGKQWDTEIIDAFFRVLPDILEIKETYTPREVRQRQVSRKAHVAGRGSVDAALRPG